METIVHMFVADMLDKELISNLRCWKKEKEKHKICMFGLDYAWLW